MIWPWLHLQFCSVLCHHMCMRCECCFTLIWLVVFTSAQHQQSIHIWVWMHLCKPLTVRLVTVSFSCFKQSLCSHLYLCSVYADSAIKAPLCFAHSNSIIWRSAELCAILIYVVFQTATRPSSRHALLDLGQLALNPAFDKDLDLSPSRATPAPAAHPNRYSPDHLAYRFR